MDNPYDIFWDTANKGQVHLLNGSRATRWRRRCSAAATTRTSDDPAILDTIKQDLLDGADAMGWKYDHVDYTELSTNGWEVHGTWSGQMVYYQYYLPKGLDITSLSYAWPPQGAGGEARPDLPRPVRHLEGRREPGAGAQVHRLHVRAGQRAHELHLRGLPAHRAVARQGRRALDKGYLPPSLDYTFVTEDMLPMGVTELELAPAVNQLYQQIYQEVTGGA